MKKHLDVEFCVQFFIFHLKTNSALTVALSYSLLSTTQMNPVKASFIAAALILPSHDPVVVVATSGMTILHHAIR